MFEPASNLALLPLEDHQLDVWLVFYHRIVDERLLSRMGDLMSEHERFRQARFHLADDRKRYLVTRAMARTVLSHYAPVDPSAWTFATNPYGRPHVAHRLAPDLSFNISHTRGLIALAVGRGRELGVDVENISARPVSLDVADYFFAPSEVANLGKVPPERRPELFFEYWTFKEAYIKARGMGLSLALDKFSFSFPNERAVRITIDPALNDNADRWALWQYRPSAQHLIALCAEKRSGKATSVTLRTLVPLVGYQLDPCLPRKTSGG